MGDGLILFTQSVVSVGLLALLNARTNHRGLKRVTYFGIGLAIAFGAVAIILIVRGAQ